VRLSAVVKEKGALCLRKAFSFILVLILLFGMMVPASAAEKVQVNVTYPTGTAVGKTFTVTVSVSGNTGLNGAQMTLAYDDSVLKCKKAQTGAVLSGMLQADNPDHDAGAMLVAVGDNTSTKDGTICTFEFEVLKTGEYGFALNELMLIDSKGNAIPITVTGMHYSEPEENKPTGSDKPSSDHKTEAPDLETTFTDTKNHWAAVEIEEAVDTGLVEGYGDAIYGPNDRMTRGQFVTILWRYAGSPEPKGKASFTDLEPQHTYYHKAVAWAEENGVVNGMGNGKFEPAGNVTREQIAVTLFRMQGAVSGGELMFTGIYDDAFSDSGNVSDWAKAAVYWAVYQDIWCATDSTSTGDTLDSRAASNRAQIAVMMTRYQERFSEGE